MLYPNLGKNCSVYAKCHRLITTNRYLTTNRHEPTANRRQLATTAEPAT